MSTVGFYTDAGEQTNVSASVAAAEAAAIASATSASNAATSETNTEALANSVLSSESAAAASASAALSSENNASVEADNSANSAIASAASSVAASVSEGNALTSETNAAASAVSASESAAAALVSENNAAATLNNALTKSNNLSDVSNIATSRTNLNVYSKEETDNGRKNYFINGNFDIWQRGSTFSSNINEYTADRWVARNGIGGTTTIFKADNPITGAYLSMQCVGNTSYAALWQVIEVPSPRDVEDKPFTLSIETDFDNAAEMEVESYWVDSDTQALRSAIVHSSVVNIGAGTETNSVSFSAPTITTPTGDLNLVVSIIFNRQSSLPDGFYRVFRAQLEEGSVATPFEYRPIGEELALCQRYFQVGYFIAGDNANLGSPTVSKIYIRPYPVVMRAVPTATLFNTTLHNVSDLVFNPRIESTQVTVVYILGSAPAGRYAATDYKLDAEL